MAHIPQPTLRNLLANPDLKVGLWVNEFMTPAIGHILKSAGCDLVVFDMEHSGLGFETVRAALRAAEAAGVATMVRPPSKLSHDIGRALDLGAKSLVLQMVDSAEEARELVSMMKYRPRGKRGVTMQHFYDRFEPGPLAPKLAEEDAATVLVALVETRLGLSNADAIAGVEGVDGLYLGHVDLSVDLGIAGDYENPNLVEANRMLARACRKHGKHFIWDAGAPGEMDEMIALGARVIMCGADTIMLCDAVTAATENIRRRFEQRR